MFLEKRKIYYPDKRMLVFDFKAAMVVFCVVLFYIASMFYLGHSILEYKKKVPMKLTARDAVKLTDLVVKYELSNYSQIEGRPGNWFLVKDKNRIALN